MTGSHSFLDPYWTNLNPSSRKLGEELKTTSFWLLKNCFFRSVTGRLFLVVFLMTINVLTTGYRGNLITNMSVPFVPKPIGTIKLNTYVAELKLSIISQIP